VAGWTLFQVREKVQANGSESGNARSKPLKYTFKASFGSLIESIDRIVAGAVAPGTLVRTARAYAFSRQTNGA